MRTNHDANKQKDGLKGMPEYPMNSGMPVRIRARNKSKFAFERRHIPA
jgi:hypothetical protein